MAQYYYVVDTAITNSETGVAVGQTTYDLLIAERENHGVIPVNATVGLWEEISNNLSPDDSAVGITTNRLVRINNDLRITRNSIALGDLSVSGITTVTNLVGTGATFSQATFSQIVEFDGGVVDKFEKAGTTLGSQTNNPLSDGNAILFTGNESGNLTINFTGVHAALEDGDSTTFTVVLTPNSSGRINTVQIDGATPGNFYWEGGSTPTAGSSGRDFYTFVIFKTGTGTTNYEVYGSKTNYS
jgi:hypothetical protein